MKSELLLTFRKLTSQDLVSCVSADWENETSPKYFWHWSFAEIQKEVIKNNAEGFFLGARLVGLWVPLAHADATEILYFWVHPKFRQQGLALKALNQIQVQLNKPLWLEVHSQNHRALQLYKKFGFVCDSIRKAYYSDGHDAWVMSFGNFKG